MLQPQKTSDVLLNELQSENETVRYFAVATLAERKVVNSYPQLFEMLQKDTERIRLLIAGVLGHQGDSQAIPPLLEALEDDSSRVRKNAAESLSFILNDINVPDEKVIQSLMSLLLNDPEESVRKSVAVAIGRIGSATLPYILKNLYDLSLSDTQKLGCIWALGFLLDEVDVISHLIESLDIPSNVIRKEIIGYLHLFFRRANPKAIKPLMKFINDTDEEIRKAARKALIQMGVDLSE